MVRLRKLIVAGLLAIVAMATPAAAKVCSDEGASTALSIPVRYANGYEEDKPLYDGSYALIVVATEYQHWNKLPATAREGEDLRRALLAQGFHVRVICDPRGAGAGGIDEVATFIHDFGTGEKARNNRLLIYLSGHGWVDEEAFRAPSAVGVTPPSSGYFAAVDSPQPSDRAAARQMGLGSERIIALARQTTARHLMVVIDACYSAGIFTTKSPDPVAKAPSTSLTDFEKIAEPSRQFLSAGSEKEETPSPSTFAAAFVLGISGWADTNGDGVVRESELSPWLRYQVANNSGNKTTPMAGFIPASTSEISAGRGEMVFRYTPTMKAREVVALTGGGQQYLVSLAAPASPPIPRRWPDPNYRVSYFQKGADGDTVLRALDAGHVPYLTMRAILSDTTKTNGLACHPDAPAAVVREAARAMIEGGVPIKIIDRATKRVDERRYLIQALHFGRVAGAGYRALTLSDLDRITGCPNEFFFKAS